VRLTFVCLLGLSAGVALRALFPNNSLLGFLGAVLVVDVSLALLVLLVRALIRPSTSRGSTAKRIAAGVACLLLILFTVQRLLSSPDDATAIERTIATVATSSDPSYCDELVTTRYLEQTTGARPPFADDFCKSEAEGPRADSASALDAHVDGHRATAVVSFEGGSYDGSIFRLALVEEDGHWKLDRILSLARFERGAFERAYRTRLLEFGSPAESVTCALRAVRQLSDAEIESVTLKGSQRTFASIAVGCDRNGIERSLVATIGNRKYDVPPAAVECAARTIEAAGDAELVRLQLDLLAYNELILDCDGDALLEFEKRELSAHDLSPREVVCIVARLRSLPRTGQIRLAYDEPRYDALIQDCD
jgi:hypothetical protein